MITIPKEAYQYFANEISEKLWDTEPENGYRNRGFDQVSAHGELEYYINEYIAVLQWAANAYILWDNGGYYNAPYSEMRDITLISTGFSLIDENGDEVENDFAEEKLNEYL